ncbi:MAG: gluconate 2-dehydrogenase subunit 3 family protein [Vicinamibacterales bacterium]
MSDITRREALGRLALAFTVAGVVDRLDAQQAHTAVHDAAAAAGGTYQPKALTPQQFLTLERLADLIVPVDNGKPGAVQAQVPAWIDSLLNVNAELKSRYVAGLGWLDATMEARHGSDFATAMLEQQTGLLDRIAYRKNRSPELDPGIDFFILARRMTVDGFYTSPIGMRDLYPGNTPRAEFTVPQEAYDYVLGRSPFK